MDARARNWPFRVKCCSNNDNNVFDCGHVALSNIQKQLKMFISCLERHTGFDLNTFCCAVIRFDEFLIKMWKGMANRIEQKIPWMKNGQSVSDATTKIASTNWKFDEIQRAREGERKNVVKPKSGTMWWHVWQCVVAIGLQAKRFQFKFICWCYIHQNSLASTMKRIPQVAEKSKAAANDVDTIRKLNWLDSIRCVCVHLCEISLSTGLSLERFQIRCCRSFDLVFFVYFNFISRHRRRRRATECRWQVSLDVIEV